MKTRQSFKLVIIILKAKGGISSPRENEKKKEKKEMGFARREAEIKHKTQENEHNKKENKERTHSSEKKSL